MDLEIIILSEISDTEKDKYYMISLIHGIKKKRDTNELICKADSETLKSNLWIPKGKCEGRIH